MKDIVTAKIENGKISFDKKDNLIPCSEALLSIQIQAIRRGVLYLTAITLFRSQWDEIINKPISLGEFDITKNSYTLSFGGEQTTPIPMEMLSEDYQPIIQTAIENRKKKYLEIQEAQKLDSKQYWLDKFKGGNFDPSKYNWCISRNRVYIMGEGAEQKVACWETDSEQQAIDDIKSFGINRWLYI